MRDAIYNSARLAQCAAQLDEFDAIHARQPGYQGNIVVDIGNGRWLTVNLWESEVAAKAALPKMVPEVERLLTPLLTAPAQLIGAGPVVATDLTRA